MMKKRAVIIYGPSGVGKSTLSKKISEKLNFRHCTADEFKFIFSDKRSKLRSSIGEALAYQYAKILIENKLNIILEAIPDNFLKKLKKILREKKYKVVEISLVASLDECKKRDMLRGGKKYGPRVIKEVYNDLSFKRGKVVNVEDKKTQLVFREIKQYLK